MKTIYDLALNDIYLCVYFIFPIKIYVVIGSLFKLEID